VEVDGVQEFAHVPNTGRLKELLVDGAAVMVRKYDKTDRKTRFGLILVEKTGYGYPLILRMRPTE